MKEILHNMANHLLVEFCMDKGIDCSGTYCVQDGRANCYQRSYVLRLNRPDEQRPNIVDVARVTLHKSQVPTYGWN